MTLRLIVMRHATAVPATWNDEDHARALTAHGVAESQAVATQLTHHGWQPVHIIHSDALRTTQTAQTLCQNLDPPPPRTATADLYLASPHTLRRVLAAWPTSQSPLLVLAHNPGVSSFATALCDCRLSMPPGAAALLEHVDADDWALALMGESAWRLVSFIRPVP